MFYTTENISEHISKTPEGFLVCAEVPIARIGDYEYTPSEVPIKSANGSIVTIHRDEDEVFSSEAIMSFNGKPVTINHPSDFVTPENWTKYAVGTVQNVRRGDGEKEDLLLADLLITTEHAIELVEAGLRQISCGYDATYEDNGNGEGRQKNIIGNHVALVLQGRAGNRCSIQDHVCIGCGRCNCGKNNNTEDEKGMKKKAVDFFKKIFPKSRFKDALSEEDLGELNEEAVESSGGGVEEALQAAEEAKAAAAEAVEAAKKAEECAQSVAAAGSEGGGNAEGAGAGAEDDEGGEGDFKTIVMQRLDALENLIKQALGATGSEDDGEETEEEKQKKLEAEQAMKDAEEETKEDEEIAKEFQDIAANALILDPNLVINCPKKGLRKFTDKLKREALKGGLTSDCAAQVKKVLNGRTVDSLKTTELDAMFIAASSVSASTRDAKVQISKMIPQKKAKAPSNAEINQRNKEFWKRDK